MTRWKVTALYPDGTEKSDSFIGTESEVQELADQVASVPEFLCRNRGGVPSLIYEEIIDDMSEYNRGFIAGWDAGYDAGRTLSTETSYERGWEDGYDKGIKIS